MALRSSLLLLLLLFEPAYAIDPSIDEPLQLAEADPRVVTVRLDGHGEYRTVAEAVESIPEGNRRRTVVRIGPGVYREKVTVPSTKPYVTLYGEPEALPTITYDGRAAEYGTLGSATVIVDSDYFVACNVIFENSAPRPVLGVKGAQAVALRVTGDKAAFYNCSFYGFQDTLCDDKGMHYFRNCLIRGTVDFIFGNGRSLYEECTIQSLSTDGVTALTAHGRYSLEEGSGFSFLGCRITGTGSVFLSRAWKPMARVVFAYSRMDSVVHPHGWDDMGHPGSRKSVFYGEYKCTGPGANTGRRVSYSKVLSYEEARPFIGRWFVRGAAWILPPPQL